MRERSSREGVEGGKWFAFKRRRRGSRGRKKDGMGEDVGGRRRGIGWKRGRKKGEEGG